MLSFLRSERTDYVHRGSHGSRNRNHHQSNGSARTPRAADDPATTHPVALPSTLEKRYRGSGPVQGTAVLDDTALESDDAVALFEMVTPENSPLLKTHVKERFEAAAEEELEMHRKEQLGASESSSDAPASSPNTAAHEHTNTFDYFPTPDLAFDSFRKSKSHHRRKVLKEGGYFIFSDSYLTAHPTSCITGVTNELHMAAPDHAVKDHHPGSGAEAEKQRAQEVKDYIREAEHEYRPIFRRRRSGMVYGRAEYVQPGGAVPQGINGSMSNSTVSSSHVYYADPVPATQKVEVMQSATKPRGLRRLLSNALS